MCASLRGVVLLSVVFSLISCTKFSMDKIFVEIQEAVIVSDKPVAVFHVSSNIDIRGIAPGVECSTDKTFADREKCKDGKLVEFLSDKEYVVASPVLQPDKIYYYRPYLLTSAGDIYGEIKEFRTCHPYNYSYELDAEAAVDLSSSGTANCYVVSEPGLYKFKTVKGNGTESVGDVATCSVLWETYAGVSYPSPGGLIEAFDYDSGTIVFRTPEEFKEGNASIAAKDGFGNVLWSWHIWVTDAPQGQEYYHGAGVMMDRNLGATSAVYGGGGLRGLKYQWGRKDPFMGDLSNDASTVRWPEHRGSDRQIGTIEYAVANPMVYIKGNSANGDWYFTGQDVTDNTRWTTSESPKSVYDPCPVGWRVPDGAEGGVWASALGAFPVEYVEFDSEKSGIDFSGIFGDAEVIWYPSVSAISGRTTRGYYWSASPFGQSSHAWGMSIGTKRWGDDALSWGSNARSMGCAVRCIKE